MAGRRECPKVQCAVAAAVRHIVIRAPDKAEFRATAVDSAMALLANLPPDFHRDFCVFVIRLSRTPKASICRTRQESGSAFAPEAGAPPRLDAKKPIGGLC